MVKSSAIFFAIFKFPLDPDYSIVIAPENARPAGPRELLSTRYELGSELARGAAATAYEAWDRHLNRRVALKIIDPRRTRQHANEVLQETKTLGRLEHPGIVPIYDAGQLEDGRFYFAMRFIQGEPLSALFAREKSL